MSALANNFRMKFAGMLRGLLRRVDSDEIAEPQTAHPALHAVPPSPAPAPVAPMANPAPVAPVPRQRTSAPSASELEMPLLPILERLPADLRAKWMVGGVDLGQATIAISVEKVLPQLAMGAVKITFGELRKAAPTLFRSGEEYDSLPVPLPLNEVLSKLNPALIARNPAQKAVTAPTEVSEPFGPGGQGAAVANTLLKPTPPTTHFFKKPAQPPEQIKMPSSPPVAAPPPGFAQRTITPTPSAPISPMTPRMNGNGNGNGSHPIFQTPPPATPARPPFPTPPPAAPARPPIPFIAPAAPAARPEPIKPLAPVPAVSAPSVSTPSAAPEAPAILVSLIALSENWPESLRQEIVQRNLTTAKVALPVHLIEPALKRGRVILSWHHLRAWIRPTPPDISVHDGTELELPLKVLAPLFVPKQPAARPQTKAALPPESVPNLFFGFPQPQPETVPDVPELPEEVQATPMVKSVDEKIAETNYYVWGDASDTARVDEADYKRPPTPATDFTSRRAMPKEIIEAAMKLQGVAGAIIALGDGLKVACQLPPELNADTVAAFLPQLFSRVSGSSKELRMGELNNLNFTLGNTAWKIFRVNAVYFAAFGHEGKPLPTAQLVTLAGELDRKK